LSFWCGRPRSAGASERPSRGLIARDRTNPETERNSRGGEHAAILVRLRGEVKQPRSLSCLAWWRSARGGQMLHTKRLGHPISCLRSTLVKIRFIRTGAALRLLTKRPAHVWMTPSCVQRTGCSRGAVRSRHSTNDEHRDRAFGEGISQQSQFSPDEDRRRFAAARSSPRGRPCSITESRQFRRMASGRR
jgi:hypothetical protein